MSLPLLVFLPSWLAAKPLERIKSLTTLLNDYKIRLQNADKDNLKKDKRLNTLRTTVACLQEGQEMLKT